MKTERRILIQGHEHTILISDEPEALLAAKAAGRAVVGVENGGADLRGIPYVVPDIRYATKELGELVLRRHLGLPWIIEETKRLVLRELVKEDGGQIPAEEYAREEAIFRDPNFLEAYIKNQYGFCEYGTWAVTLGESGQLIGLAGVSNPKLPGPMEKWLEQAEENGPWLELGYHIFRPFRKMGYGGEAAAAAVSYSHEVLNARLCALIYKENKASRALAESLGMKIVMETDTGERGSCLLYAENCS